MLSSTTRSTQFCWTVVVLLTLANTVSFVDRMLLTMLVEPIKQSLALSDTQIGMLHGLPFALFYATVGLWLGRVADRSHRPRLIAFGMAVWSAATIACAFAAGFATMFGSRILVAIGEAALAPAAYALIADLFIARKLGRALSVYQIGLYVGSGLALALGGIIAGSDQASMPWGMEPWRLAFIIAGVPGIILAAIFACIPEVRSKVTAETSLEKSGDSFERYLMKNLPVYAVVYGAYALVGVAVYATNAWMPTILIRTHAFELRQAGLLLGLIFLLATPLGVLTAGLISDRSTANGKHGHLVVGAALGIALLGPAVLAYAFAPSATVALVLAVPVAFLLSYPFGFSAFILQLITPVRFRGSASAAYLFIFTLIGYGLGPLLVGLITDHVFADESAVGKALSIVACISAPAAGALLIYGQRILSQSLAKAEEDRLTHASGPA